MRPIRFVVFMLIVFLAFSYLYYASVMTDEWMLQRLKGNPKTSDFTYFKLGGWHPFGRKFIAYSYNPEELEEPIYGGWVKGYVDWFGNVHITFRS